MQGSWKVLVDSHVDEQPFKWPLSILKVVLLSLMCMVAHREPAQAVHKASQGFCTWTRGCQGPQPLHELRAPLGWALVQFQVFAAMDLVKKHRSEGFQLQDNMGDVLVNF